MDYILTNDGAALMTRAVTGKNLIFTRAETGKGYSSSPAILKSVIGRQQELDLSVVHEGSDVRISCFLTNRQLEEGYVMKQIGVYGRLEEDETETLVIVGQEYSGEMIHPYADGEAEYEFVILMKASGTSTIIVESGAGSLVTKRELNGHVARMDNPHGVTAEQIGLGKVQNVAPKDMMTEFEEAEERENIESGEKHPVLFGKIRRWLSDLKAAAFCSVANHCMTTEAGTVLDGRQGTYLQNQITELKEADDEINSNIPNFIYDSNGKIIGYKSKDGADTVFPFKSSVLVSSIVLYIYSSGRMPQGNYMPDAVLTTANNGYTTVKFDVESFANMKYTGISNASTINVIGYAANNSKVFERSLSAHVELDISNAKYISITASLSNSGTAKVNDYTDRVTAQCNKTVTVSNIEFY